MLPAELLLLAAALENRPRRDLAPGREVRDQRLSPGHVDEVDRPGCGRRSRHEAWGRPVAGVPKLPNLPGGPADDLSGDLIEDLLEDLSPQEIPAALNQPSGRIVSMAGSPIQTFRSSFQRPWVPG